MALNVILDVILFGSLVFGIIIGVRKGFIKIVTKPLRPLLAISIALAAASPVAESIIVPLINEPLTNQISSFLYDNCAHITSENIEELPTLVKLAASLAGIDFATMGDGTNEIMESIVGSLTLPIVNIISTIVAFVILFIFFNLLLAAFFSVMNSVFSKGAFGALNMVLGSVTSLLLSAFIAWALVSVFEYVIHFPKIADSPLLSEFTGGFLYAFFKQYNPVELLLSF